MAALTMDSFVCSTGKPHHVFASLASSFTTWKLVRLTQSLSRLTDRELDDNGLCFGDIDTIAFGG